MVFSVEDESGVNRLTKFLEVIQLIYSLHQQKFGVREVNRIYLKYQKQGTVNVTINL